MDNDDFIYAEAAEELITELFDEWQADVGTEFPEREQWEQAEKKAVETFCTQKGYAPNSQMGLMFWAFRAGVNKGVKIAQIIGAIDKEDTKKGSESNE